MDQNELKAIVEAEIHDSLGYLSGDLTDQRRKSLEYYYGEPYGNEVEGRSSAVSTDTQDTIEWIMPSLMKVFTSGDEVVKFHPQGPEDVAAAAQATDYVNYIFNRDNNGFSVLHDMFKDALIQKTGVVKHYWDDTTTVEREEYFGLGEDEYTALLMDEDVEIVEHTELVEEMDGEMAGMMPPAVSHDVVLKRTHPDGRVRIEPVPPEEFLINRRARSLEDADFVAHRVKRTVSELKQMGYKDLENVTGDAGQEWNEESVARYDYEDNRFGDSDSNDKSMRAIWLYECYLKVDCDGDEVAELRKVTVAGNKVLDNEEIDEIPFSAITPIRMPHKFHGMSVADLVMDLQLIKSTLLRNLLDNMYLTNNGRYTVLEGQANLDDLLTSRPGGIVRVKSPTAVAPLSNPQMSPHVFQMLDYIDNIREERSGVSKNQQGLGEGALKSHQTASGVSQVMSASQQRIEMIARVFAETGIKHMFQSIYGLVQRHQIKERVVELRNSWVPVNPSDWKEKLDLTVSVGLGYGNKDQNLMHLTQIAQMTQMIAANGGAGTLVQPKNVYNLMCEILKNSGFKNVDDFITRPPEGPMPDMPDPEEQAKQMEAQLKVAELQQKQKEAEIDAQIKEQELVLKKEEAQIDMQIKAEELRIKRAELNLKQQELTLEAVQQRPVAIG